MSKKVADIIVENLQSAGVKHCYGVVGDTLNLIARSLERSKIEWVSVRRTVNRAEPHTPTWQGRSMHRNVVQEVRWTSR